MPLILFDTPLFFWWAPRGKTIFSLKAKGFFQKALAFRQGAGNGAARDRPENLPG
jgi:hypothetical protein